MASNIGALTREEKRTEIPASLDVSGSFGGRTARHKLERVADDAWRCGYGSEDWVSVYALAAADFKALGKLADEFGRPVSLLVTGVNSDVREAYTQHPFRSIRLGPYDRAAKELRLEILPVSEHPARTKNH
jgi:hypothetical protein